MKSRSSIVFLVFVVVFQVKAKTLVYNKYGPYYGARRQSFDLDFDEMEDNEHSDAFGYKRSIDGVHPFKRSIFGNTRKRSPYGLVYNQGKPIGILEPIGQAFEYASYPVPRDLNLRANTGFKSQWYPSKRESAVEFDIGGGDFERTSNEEDNDLREALHSSNYANVLAKFKVNNKVKHRPYREFLCAQQVKRNAFVDEDASRGDQQQQQLDPTSSMIISSISNAASMLEDSSTDSVNKKKDREEMKKRGALDLGDLTSTQQKQEDEQVVKIDSDVKSSSKVKRKISEKAGDADENLKEAVDDMNFIEKDGSEQQKDDKVVMKKREIYFEDEDLENGLNKIGLTKESHFDRNKKEDSPLKSKIVTKSLKNVKKTKVEKSIHKKAKKKSRKDSDEPKRIVKSAKRSKNNSGFENSKITKIANYESEGEEFLRKKRQTKDVEREDSDIMKGLESSGDLTVSGNKSPLVAVSNDETEKKSQEKRDKEELEYEKRLERNIEDKINSIKEEVKREISQLQSDDENIDDDPQRKKRDVNNLMECESSDLDPGVNIEEVLEPHIRKRRGTEISDDKSKLNHDDSEDDTQPKEMESNPQIVNGEESLKSKSEEEVLVNKRQDQPVNQEEEKPQEMSKDKPVNKRASKSSQAKEEEEDDRENSDDEEDAEKEASLMKRNQKKEKEKKRIQMEETDENDDEQNSKKRDVDLKQTENVNDEATTEKSKINKRNDASIDITAKEQSEIDGVMDNANSIVKRNEDLNTDKNIVPRPDLEGNLEEENRQERSPKDKEKLKEVNLKSNDGVTKRDQRSPERPNNKPVGTNKIVKERQQKRSTNEMKPSLVPVVELDKPAPSKSIILNEQELGKEPLIEERSVGDTDKDPSQTDQSDGKSLNQESSAQVEKENNEMNQSVQKITEDDETNMELKEKRENDIKRRRRSLYNQMLKRSSRKKRDGSWNDQSNSYPVGYRADDGEIDDEDDEMQDDGFDDQTSNLVNKRNVDDEDIDGPEYPTYMERNKRNALRLYDDEVGEDETFDNFLFYPKKYSRTKRNDNLRQERSLRRKRQQIEQRIGAPMLNRESMSVEKSDISGLSEADIFGGLPQSYEGELSRFKRVKREAEV